MNRQDAMFAKNDWFEPPRRQDAKKICVEIEHALYVHHLEPENQVIYFIKNLLGVLAPWRFAISRRLGGS